MRAGLRLFIVAAVCAAAGAAGLVELDGLPADDHERVAAPWYSFTLIVLAPGFLFGAAVFCLTGILEIFYRRRGARAS